MTDKNPIVVSADNTRVRFEQWAKNPTCEANTISAVLDVAMGQVAEKLGYKDKKELPPFAIARGNQFEHYLFENEGERIVQAMRKEKLLSADEEVEFFDYRFKGNVQGLSKSAERSKELSEKLLAELISGKASKKTKVISGLTLKLAKGVMLPEAKLYLDCLLIQWGSELDVPRWKLKVGEIKIFPDRGGYTDPNQISSARAQAGVYKHALDDWTAERKVGKSFDINDFGFLVFTWPGSTFPVIRPNEDLRSQASRAKEGFARMDIIGSRVIADNPENYDPKQYADWVAHSKTNFREACWSFCDLASRCQDEALANGRAVFLGTDPARLLGTVTMNRAVELINGADPESPFEETLQAQLLNAENGLL
jgi:hypothetical protein